jgi:hypothetical protein
MRITGVLAFVAGLAVFCSTGVGLPVGYDWQEWPVGQGGNGHFYALTQTCGELGDGIGTWSEAYSEATSIGGYLATINISAEQNWLNATFPRTTVGRVDEELWIGLHQVAGSAEPQEGWEWVTGEPVTFTNWYPGEPNEGPPPESNEDCVLMHGFETGKWIDVPNEYGIPVGHGFYGIIEVPEPATLTLLALGGLAAIRRKR